MIFADDKRKAVLIRGLETPFWKTEKSAIWYAFEPETRFCRDDKRKVILNAFIDLRPTYVKACALHGLCSSAGQTAQCSCAVTMPSSRLILTIEFDDKRNNSRNVFRKAFACTRFDSGYWNVFLLLGKMINTAIVNWHKSLELTWSTMNGLLCNRLLIPKLVHCTLEFHRSSHKQKDYRGLTQWHDMYTLHRSRNSQKQSKWFYIQNEWCPWHRPKVHHLLIFILYIYK